MAGKKIASKKKVDAGGPVSKTARASKAKKKEEGFIASGDMDRIIPLCDGEWAYLLDPRDGKTHHIRVGSEKWNNLIEILVNDVKHGDRIRNQIVTLGW
jgi:hypothetical protein